MGNRDQTRETLLDVGQRIFLEKGYNSAGIEAVLKAAGVPKGSFYYYFGSKEDFGLSVIDRFAAEHAEGLERELSDPALGPLDRLRRHFEAAVERFEAEECRRGCLIGKLCQEMAEQNEAFRDRLRAALDRSTGLIAACLGEAQQAGEVRANLNPQAVAELLIDGWQGALQRSKAFRSSTPLRSFLDVVFGDVVRPT